MIILDTNVISELIRPDPNPQVIDWVKNRPGTEMFLSVVSEAELLYGVEMLPAGRRRDRLALEIENMLRDDLGGRVLPFDRAAAREYGLIAAGRRSMGRPIGMADCQIAATARCRNFELATGNVNDFQECGVRVINPWENS